MSQVRPRLPALEWEKLDPERQEALKNYFIDGRLYNVFRVFIRNLKMFQRHSGFADYIMRRSFLTPRHRELAIIRIGYLNRSQYECAHHAKMGLEAGLTEEETVRVAAGADAPGWGAPERALLRAVDQLKLTSNIDDDLYRELEKHFDEHQLIDLVMTVGNYNMMSTALNVFGVEVEDHVALYRPLLQE